MPVPCTFISVSELKQLIMTSGKYGRGRTRGRPMDDIAISNAQTGEGSFKRARLFSITCRLKLHRRPYAAHCSLKNMCIISVLLSGF